ncbi:hypothetical protein SLEP1_g58985 [Rubroshorea leprosula]|uniref:Uncharacterized protein n=1 Tax=Rubroshorea leprosula TaxID=152421 RepID=A0AAV5MRF7_9ROSI|nr:hypothetical protein SLEP1_g58985 [Rubroshorea leprosula]
MIGSTRPARQSDRTQLGRDALRATYHALNAYVKPHMKAHYTRSPDATQRKEAFKAQSH